MNAYFLFKEKRRSSKYLKFHNWWTFICSTCGNFSGRFRGRLDLTSLNQLIILEIVLLVLSNFFSRTLKTLLASLILSFRDHFFKISICYGRQRQWSWSISTTSLSQSNIIVIGTIVWIIIPKWRFWRLFLGLLGILEVHLNCKCHFHPRPEKFVYHL